MPKCLSRLWEITASNPLPLPKSNWDNDLQRFHCPEGSSVPFQAFHTSLNHRTVPGHVSQPSLNVGEDACSGLLGRIGPMIVLSPIRINFPIQAIMKLFSSSCSSTVFFLHNQQPSKPSLRTLLPLLPYHPIFDTCFRHSKMSSKSSLVTLRAPLTRQQAADLQADFQMISSDYYVLAPELDGLTDEGVRAAWAAFNSTGKLLLSSFRSDFCVLRHLSTEM